MTAPEPITLPPLKLCPFCGSDAVWFKIGRDIGIECRDGFECPGRAQTNVYVPEHRQTVIDEWNRRHADEAAEFKAEIEVDRSRALADASQASDEAFGIEDESALTRAVCVMNDVLTDISGWEDKALAEAVKSSKVDLCAMIECIRMRADGSYVPGTKPIDGELATPAPTVVPDASKAVVGEASDYVSVLEYSAEDIVAEWGKGFESGFDSGKKHGAKRAALTPSPAPSAAPQGADALREAPEIVRAEPWLKSDEMRQRLDGEN